MKDDSDQPLHYNVEFRALLLCIGFVALLTGISIRLIDVQHNRHEEVRDRLTQTSFRKEIDPAKRGDIADRHRRPLATSQPVSDIYFDWHKKPDAETTHKIASQRMGIDPAELKDYTPSRSVKLYYQMLAARMAPIIECNADELLTRLDSGSKNPLLASKIDGEIAKNMIERLEQEGFKGLHRVNGMARAYITDDLACHLLGFVQADLQGAAGIELKMNEFLTGVDGARYYDKQGELVKETLPQHGKNVVLTIDATFQNICERIMDRHYEALRPAAMTAIFAEPSTGEILALVNRPGFRPSDGGNADPVSQRNTAVASVYEPGSTFKIVTIGSALDQRLVGLDDWINCHNGHYFEDGWSLKDASRGRETATVRDVLAYSLNTGTFMIAQQLKPAVFYKYMADFGLGRDTGILLPAEESGRIPNPKEGWGRKRMQLSRLAMGYTLNASPLQILGLMNVVCNQGNLVRPRVVREILSNDYQEVTARHEPEIVRRVISAKTANRLRNALIHAVEKGTGKRTQIEGFVVGGKTGTAGKVINGGYLDNRNIASFLGFIGTEADTALIGIVLVDDPQNEGKRHGGSVAGPIFKEIAEAGMHHFGIRKLAVVDPQLVQPNP